MRMYDQETACVKFYSIVPFIHTHIHRALLVLLVSLVTKAIKEHRYTNEIASYIAIA